MIEIKDILTHEKLKKKFKNDFDMVNIAIRLAKKIMQRGDEVILENLIEELASLDKEVLKEKAS